MDPRRLLLPLAVTIVLTLALTAWVAVRDHAEHPRVADPAAARAPGEEPVDARRVLAEWDAARSRAWADGDVGALRHLYVPGSRSGRNDAKMLSAYVDRGLVVQDLTTQVLALEVLDRRGGLLRLRVTDRVAGGEVVRQEVSRSGALDARLPTDEASTRVVTLREHDGRWRVDEVRDAG